MLRPCSALQDRRFPLSGMPTAGTTGESPAPHLSSSPATTCTPRAHSPLPLSRPERLSPARGTLICGMRARQDPWKGPRSSNKCACQHLGRPAIRAALEPVPVKVEGGWRRYNGCGGTVPQYTKDTAQCAAIHHTGTATEEKSLPPAAGLGWKGGNLPPMVIQLHTLIAIGRGG